MKIFKKKVENIWRKLKIEKVENIKKKVENVWKKLKIIKKSWKY